jgi:hypothetical protein
VLLILSSCATLSPSSTLQTHPTQTSGTQSGHIPGIRFIDTWNNIHLFQTFDYNISDPVTIAKNYDFVWGAQLDKVAAFRASNPNILISYYLPFHRDRGTYPAGHVQHDLAFWKAFHPDWVLYTCDRVTPAFEFGDPDIPLDFSNPAIVPWQVQTYAQPASVGGYDAIAADNVDIQNGFGACGVYRKGQWVQLYSGQMNDPRWRADVIKWLRQMQKALHGLRHPLALIANISWGGLSSSDPSVQQAVSYVDGVLDEGGFTDFGSGYLTDSQWLQRVQFIEKVQRQHKPYYTIDEFPTVGRAEIQWAIASYLMGKEHAASLFISTIQRYGAVLWYHEYDARIGSPSGPMYQAQHVYSRDYSNGLSIVNPSATETATVVLNAGRHYTDLYGNPVGQLVTMPPHSGMVLLL